jgi:hypothetical protein
MGASPFEEAPMSRFYEKLSEADRATFRRWQIAVAGTYGAVILLIIAVLFAERAVGNRVAKAAQAEMTSAVRPAADPAQVMLKTKRQGGFFN